MGFVQQRHGPYVFSQRLGILIVPHGYTQNTSAVFE
jgi:hypothetical protein